MPKKKYKSKKTSRFAGQPRTWRGKEVTDAVNPLECVISPADVKKGAILDLANCAAAVRLKEDCGAISVEVGRAVTLIEFENFVLRQKTPAPIRDQLLRYDASHEYKEFSPGSYTFLPIPRSIIQSRGKRHSDPDRARGNPKNKRIRRKAKKSEDKGRPAIYYKGEENRA